VRSRVLLHVGGNLRINYLKWLRKWKGNIVKTLTLWHHAPNIKVPKNVDNNLFRRGIKYRGRKHVIRSVEDFLSRFFAFFIVKYTIIIPCRVVHSEYIFQLRNHARNGACRSHWSTTGLNLYGWPNKNFELNIN
jgi:hypothetical protein